MPSRPTPLNLRQPITSPAPGTVAPGQPPSTALATTQPATAPVVASADRFSLSLHPISSELVPSRHVGSLALMREALSRRAYTRFVQTVAELMGATVLVAVLSNVPLMTALVLGTFAAIGVVGGGLLSLLQRNEDLRLTLLVRNIFSFTHPVSDFDTSSISLPDIYRPDSSQQTYPDPNSPAYQARRRKLLSIEPGKEKSLEMIALMEKKMTFDWSEWQKLAQSHQEDVLGLHPHDPALGFALRVLLILSIEARFASRGNIDVACLLAENYFKAVQFFDKDMPDRLRRAIQETIHQPLLRQFYREVGVFSVFRER